MSYWAALIPDTPPGAASPHDEQLLGVAIWALQWTPRVGIVDEAVVMEVEASLRLFGGARALQERVRTEAAELGVGIVSWASTSLAALAFARAGLEDGFARPLSDGLDRLPFETLTAVGKHQPILARLGCKTIGDVRKLPRGGLSRRFDKAILTALDEAYGLRAEVHEWITLPETFSARLELMSRVDLAPALMFSARRLLVQMCGWLAARHSGVAAFKLQWAHDSMRSKEVADTGEIVIRTGEATRNLDHLSRLLNENLSKTKLLAPVGEITLSADDVTLLEEHSASLLPDTVRQGESIREVLERIAARLGPERVVRPMLSDDHRAEWAQYWQTAAERQPSRPAAVAEPDAPQPTWLLPTPLKLAVRNERPLYQGELLILTGPHRVEGGWWDRVEVEGQEVPRHVQRDYWVAVSQHAGVLWIYQERLAENTAWYLQGIFA